MKIIPFIEGSKQWHSWRHMKIGASDCASIMGCGRKSPSDLWDEKVLGKEPLVTPAMERGSSLESRARAYAERLLRLDLPPICCESEEFPWMIASLDGYDNLTGYFVELKCPGESVYKSCERGQWPQEWIWQVQHQLSVTGCEKAFLLAYDGENGCIKCIERDETMIDDLKAKEEAFYRSMVEFLRPEDPLSEEPKAIDAVRRLNVAKDLIKQGESLEQMAREELIRICGDRRGYTCGDARVFRFPIKGSIDYSKIPELYGVDLDKYRKPPREQWRIS